MNIFDIWLLLAVILAAASFAMLYEWGAMRLHLYPSITQEVRHGERTHPIIYAPVFFLAGLLLGHFWI